jgi:DHA1 family multidrug resistance protein-like MFS transporter
MSAGTWQTLLAAICVAQGVAIIGFDFTLPFVPLYLQHDLGVHGLGQVAIWSGLIGFGPAIPATIFGPVWGRLADRLGYRFMLLRAMTSAALILACMGLAPNPWVLFGLRMLQGSLTGTVFSAQALVAAAVPEKETGRAMGLLQMSVFIGATIGPVGGGAVAQLISFRAAYVGAGLLLAAATIVVYLFAWEPERRATQTEGEGARPSMWSVLAVPAFAVALGLILLAQLAGTSLYPIIPLFVQDLLGSARNVAGATGWLMAATAIAGGIGSYAAGRLYRRFGAYRLLAVTITLSALLLLPQAFVHTFLAFVLFRCGGALAFGGLISVVGTLAATSSPPEAKGTAFGLMGAASSLGFGSGPLIGGSLAAVIGIRPVFALAAVTLGAVPLLLLAGSKLLTASSSTVQTTAKTRQDSFGSVDV